MQAVIEREVAPSREVIVREWQASVGLPALRGSEKQVTWGSTIRFQKLVEQTNDVIAGAQEIDLASAWITYRFVKADSIAKHFDRMVELSATPVKTQRDVELLPLSRAFEARHELAPLISSSKREQDAMTVVRYRTLRSHDEDVIDASRHLDDATQWKKFRFVNPDSITKESFGGFKTDENISENLSRKNTYCADELQNSPLLSGYSTFCISSAQSALLPLENGGASAIGWAQ